MYVPNTNAQTTIGNRHADPSAELKVHQQPGCGEDDRELCGFYDGDRVLIFDPSGAYSIFTITNSQDNALHCRTGVRRRPKVPRRVPATGVG